MVTAQGIAAVSKPASEVRAHHGQEADCSTMTHKHVKFHHAVSPFHQATTTEHLETMPQCCQHLCNSLSQKTRLQRLTLCQVRRSQTTHAALRLVRRETLTDRTRCRASSETFTDRTRCCASSET